MNYTKTPDFSITIVQSLAKWFPPWLPLCDWLSECDCYFPPRGPPATMKALAPNPFSFLVANRMCQQLTVFPRFVPTQFKQQNQQRGSDPLHPPTLPLVRLVVFQDPLETKIELGSILAHTSLTILNTQPTLDQIVSLPPCVPALVSQLCSQVLGLRHVVSDCRPYCICSICRQRPLGYSIIEQFPALPHQQLCFFFCCPKTIRENQRSSFFLS